MTVIILGGSGFLGRTLLNQLNQEKISFKVMQHKIKINEKNQFSGDITKEKFLENHISDNDTIINLVGQEGENVFDLNVKGAFNLLNSTIKKKNIRIIFASSTIVYGNNSGRKFNELDTPKPVTNYGIIKLLAENVYSMYAQLFVQNITILRFSNIYGTGKKIGIISNSIKAITEGKPMTITHKGKQIHDFLFIDDAVQAIIQVIKKPIKKIEIFNISSGTGIEINQILQKIEKFSNKKLIKIFDEQLIEQENRIVDNQKARKILDFSPNVNIDTGIKKIIENKNKIK